MDGNPSVKTDCVWLPDASQKNAGNTWCINEYFCEIWRKILRQDVRLRLNQWLHNKGCLLLKTVIEPNGKSVQYWKDLWRYRELALNFAKRDVTVRYKQTFIGFGWSIINPILNMLIMTFVFGNLAGFSDTASAPYQVIVYAGLIPWTLFARSFSLASGTFVQNAELMKKVYVPRLVSPLGSSLTSLIDTAISFGVLFLLMLLYHYTPSIRILLTPFMLIPMMFLGMFLGLFVSVFTIKYRDLIQIVPLMVQIGQYATPVAYSMNDIQSKVSEKASFIFLINPATGFVSAFKWCVIKTEVFDWRSFLVSIAWLIVFAPIATKLFQKAERTFVDLV